MPCPTCSHTMQRAAPDLWWCERCGTIKDRSGAAAPKLVLLVREYAELKEWDCPGWHRLGIWEAVYLPEDRPQE